MKTKKKNIKKQVSRKKKDKKPKKNREAPSVGAQIGALLGGGLQQFGTSVFNRIIGKGDYSMPDNTQEIEKNCLFQNSSNQPATFGGGRSGFVFEHEEYIGDIVSSSTIGAFNSQTFTVNPSNNITFPWLSNLATNFEMYQFDGLIFRFESTSGTAVGSTNTALGTVMGYFAYDTLDQTVISKSTLLQYEGSVDARSSENFLIGVECDESKLVMPRLYIGPPPSGSDAKTYNWGNLTIATQGMQAASVSVGELYAHYRVKFFITKQISSAASNHYYSNSVTSASNFGTSTTAQSGAVQVTAQTNTTITYTGMNVGTNYLWTYWVNTATSVATSGTTLTFVGANSVNKFKNGTNATETFVVSPSYICTAALVATNNTMVVTFNPGFTIVGAAVCDVLLTTFDNVTLPLS